MESTVNAVFADYESLKGAIATLRISGVAPKQITIIGPDCDGLREATASLQAKRIDRLFLYLGVAGCFIGAFWGYFCCPHSAFTPSVIVSTSMAVFCGAVLGTLAGGHIGAVLNLDNPPNFEAKYIEAEVEGAVAALSVSADENEQSVRVADLLGDRFVTSC